MTRNVVYNFDMDGVLCDWESMYKSRCSIPLDEFNAMSREEREVIKRDLFDFLFFYEMKPIESGMRLLHDLIADGKYVRIISATGRVNAHAVIEAKRLWVKENIGHDIEVRFVDKVEQKHIHMIPNCKNILIDDRQIAIDAWNDKGGTGILFKVSN